MSSEFLALAIQRLNNVGALCNKAYTVAVGSCSPLPIGVSDIAVSRLRYVRLENLGIPCGVRFTAQLPQDRPFAADLPDVHRVQYSAVHPFDFDLPRANRRTEIVALSYERAC